MNEEDAVNIIQQIFSSVQFQKKSIPAEDASQLLARDPVVFLERFGDCLPDPYLDKFEVFLVAECPFAYEVQFYLSQLRAKHTSRPLQDKRNRRYLYVRTQLILTDYFSDEKMKERDPLLFDHVTFPSQLPDGRKFTSFSLPHTKYVGQFVAPPRPTGGIADRLLIEFDNEMAVKRLNELKADQPEVESDSEEGEEEEEQDTNIDVESNRDELVRMMIEKFVDGRDGAHFDYRLVDENADLAVKEIQQDLEDKYFDSD